MPVLPAHESHWRMLGEQRKADRCLEGEQPHMAAGHPKACLIVLRSIPQREWGDLCVVPALSEQGWLCPLALQFHCHTHVSNVLMQWRVAKYAQEKYQWGDKKKKQVRISCQINRPLVSSSLKIFRYLKGHYWLGNNFLILWCCLSDFLSK